MRRTPAAKPSNPKYKISKYPIIGPTTTRKFSIDVILKSPPFYAIIISIILLYYDFHLPIFVENTTFLLMYATIFLILIY